MSAQRVRSTVAVDHRSIMPNMPGLPWWGAVAVAVAATAAGLALDAGNKELTTVFAALYVMGCMTAVLAVQQSGVFTTVIQPPLILFCTVPGAYWLFHGAGSTGIKGIVINCGYPLIERFPLMLFTSATVLLIGMVRWYFGMTAHSLPAMSEDDAVSDRPHAPALFEKLAGMITAALNRDPAHAIEPTASRARRTGDRPRRATADSRAEARRSGRRPTRSTATRSGATRSTARRSDETGSGPTRSRRGRPSADESLERRADRPRRPRPAPGLEEEPLPRRRPRPPQDFDHSDPPPLRSRRDPYPYAGQPAAHGGRADGYRPAEPPEPRPRRHQAPIGANGSNGANGSGTTHHPVSQVRYRKAAGDDSGTDPRGRSRNPRGGDGFDSWEYDI